jgi:nucleoside-diphosphate-sugar epimerase
MKILVIGGCGYIGSAIYRHLDDQGHAVDSMDLELRGDAGILRNDRMNYTWAHRFSDWEAVIMMAGHSSVKASIATPYAAFENNLANLARLTQHLAGQPLIFASSAAVHDEANHGNMYDITKRAAEAIVPLLYPNSWGLRFGTVAGPSPNMRLDTMVNAMVSSALRHNRVLMSNPRVWRPILGMDDLLRGIDRILDGQVPAGLHNMCSFSSSIEHIAERIGEITGTPVTEFEPSPTYDFLMTPEEWMEPTQTLDEIVAALIEHHRKGELV